MRDAPLLGAHVSTAGGTPSAPPRARAIGASAMQLFTKQAARWAERACDEEECHAFGEAIAAAGVASVAAHDSYLINLASPDETLRRRSIDSLVSELRRCQALRVECLVSHPGNYMDDRASGLARNADSIAEALEVAGGRTILCLETTAGTGTTLGSTFEELAALVGMIPAAHRSRIGICADTCHLYSAGYDLAGDYEGVWARFADALGLECLRVIHLNDSKTPLGSRRDRHELIGEGSLGEEPFRRIMNDERFARIPKIIETPKLDDAMTTDRRMLERLAGYVAAQNITR
jgi:deoxyribonuclease-4